MVFCFDREGARGYSPPPWSRFGPLQDFPANGHCLTAICPIPPLIRRDTTVNKNDLIAAVAETTGLQKVDATKAVEAVFDGITASLKQGTEVRLVGFGTFVVSQRAATEGRNPRTGETIKIPASKQPKFKAGKGLKDLVN